MSRSVRRGALAVLVVSCALALTACGGKSDEPEVASLGTEGETGQTSPSTVSDAEAAKDVLVDFTECLRDEGFDVPDPDFSLSLEQAGQRIEAAGIDTESPEFQQAVETCSPILIGILRSFTPEELEELRDASLEYARCMREEGFDVPDPDFTNGLGDLFSGVDTEEPGFDAANEKCGKAFEDAPNPFEESG